MNRHFHYAVVASSACIVGLLLFGTVSRSATPEDAPYTQLGVFTEVMTKIKLEYVEEPDIKAVTVGAVSGLLESLDKFASYLDAAQYKQYQAEHGKGKADVGLYLSRGPGYFQVVNSLPGSAGDKAGLTTGDVIESINNISTRDMPLAFAELLLQGEPGSVVEMGVLTSKNPEPATLKLTRAPLAYPAVTGRMETDKAGKKTGIIKAGALQAGRAQEIAQQVKQLEQQGAQRLILDLRFCGTGPVEEGIAVADLFMDAGLITYTQGQKSRRQDSTAVASNTVTKLPLTVLVNRGTAGAAEIAAAALQESKRANLVGEPTFGDAAVRRPITMGDGGAVIMAVAKYYAPNGKAIQDERVTPGTIQVQNDVVTQNLGLENGPSVQVPAATPNKSQPSDTILDKALEEKK